MRTLCFINLPGFRAPFRDHICSKKNRQANVSRAWWNDLEEQAAALPGPVLRVNVDETSISRDLATRKGLHSSTIEPSKTIFVNKKPPARGCLTHVAFICDDTSYQPVMPQLLIGNHHIRLNRDLDQAQGELPENVYVIRDKSSWVNTALFAAALKWMATAVRKKLPVPRYCC